MSATEKPLRFALITPSYWVDFERCRYLVETVERHVAPHVRHYLIVDRPDLPLFAPLASERTKVVLKSDLLQEQVWQVPFARRYWLARKGIVPALRLPIRGWIVQQLAKLFIHRVAEEDVFLFVDSGAFFVRDYDPRNRVRDGQVPLFREKGDYFLGKESRGWYERSLRLLGVPPAPAWDYGYVKTNVVWRRENLIALHQHLEKVHGRPSFEVLSAQLTLSEYYLYGLFCDLVLKDKSRQYHSDEIETLSHWTEKQLDAPQLRALRDQMSPEQVLVMINEKSRTPISTIREAFLGEARSGTGT